MQREDKHNFKTIWVHKSTHKKLSECGITGETYDDVLKKLLKVYKKYKDVDEQEESEVKLIFPHAEKPNKKVK